MTQTEHRPTRARLREVAISAPRTHPAHRILLVEDERIVALKAAHTLRRAGFLVTTAATGEEAIERVAAVEGDEDAVDLVLMDIDLGAGIDGTETARRILKTRQLPIVFHTSHSEQDYVDRVRQITSYGYVVKNSGEFVLVESVTMAFHLFEAHQRAEENEQRYRAVVERSGNAVAVYRLEGEDFIVVDLNRRAEEVEGVRREEIVGRRVVEVFPGIVSTPLLDVFRRVAAGEVDQEAIDFFYRDDVRFGWRRNNVYALPSGEVAAVYRDVSDEYETAAALARSDNLLDCQYAIARMVEEPGIDRAQILRRTATLVERFMRASGVVGVRIRIGDEEFVSDAFEATGTVVTAPVSHPGRSAGVMEVFHFEGGDPSSALGTSREAKSGERKFIDTIAERLGRILERLSVEAEYRSLLEDLAEAVVFVDPKGRIAYANPAACELIGIDDCSDLVGRSVLDVYADPADRPSLIARVAHEGTLRDVAFSLRHADGTVVPTLANITAVTDAEGRSHGTLAALRDVREQRRLQSELADQNARLRESEGQLRAMFDEHSAVMLLIDPDDGGIRDANRAASTFYGYSHDELCTMRIQDINELPPEQVAEERRRAAHEERRFFRFPHRLKSGELRLVEVYSAPIHVGGKTILFSIIHDTSEKEEAQRLLADARVRLELALKSSGIGVWDWNVATGETVFDRRWAEMLGYALEELLPTTVAIWERLVHPDDRAEVERLLDAHLSGETIEYVSRHRLRRKDGRWIWVSDRGRVVERDDEGHPRRMIGTHTEITDLMSPTHP